MLNKENDVQKNEFYKEEILRMVKGVDDPRSLQFIYGVTLFSYREERAGVFPQP